MFTIGFIVFIVHLKRTFWCHLCSCTQPSSFQLDLCSLEQVMESFSSYVSTVPSFDDVFSHNMWNPLLDLLFLEEVNGSFASYLVEIDLAKIALSCHLLLICYATKKAHMILHETPLGTIVHGISFYVWHRCHPCDIVISTTFGIWCILPHYDNNDCVLSQLFLICREFEFRASAHALRQT